MKYKNKYFTKKKLIILSSFLALILFVFALNITISSFTNNSINNVANIKVAGMNYNMTINGSAGSIITAPGNNTTKSNISITSLNSRDSKYELIYKVCSDASCLSFIEKPSDLIIEYSSKTTDSINGTISASGNKSIRVIITNDSSTTYYLKLNINAGYIYNTLVLQNLINNEYNEEDVTIAAVINGEISTTFPVTSTYDASVTCQTSGGASNASGSATWNGTKWVVNITGADSGRTVCNVNFVTPAPNGWFTSAPGTLLYALKGSNTLTAPATTPGRQVSTVGEAVMASTSDDYGTSYYFRGNITNNYVKFANMCWRIVRVAGNGAIKLVLYNYNPGAVGNPCDTSQDGTTNAFARYSGSIYNSTFNNPNNRNGHIGFRYGATGSTYATEHANTTKSAILNNLEAWYASKLTSYASQLADTIWCNDKSIVSGLGYGTNATQYKRNQILNSTATANPSLICPNDGTGGKLSKFTVSDTTNGNGNLTYKIGLLTADEVAYAGGCAEWLANTTYYLYKNSSGQRWWTLSPFAFGGYSDFDAIVFSVSSTGYLEEGYASGSIGVRPAVSLVSTTTVTGMGTNANPYVVTI